MARATKQPGTTQQRATLPISVVLIPSLNLPSYPRLLAGFRGNVWYNNLKEKETALNSTVKEITIDAAGFQLAALHKAAKTDAGAGTAPRLLCIHGWLDNANSFLPLFPHLDDFEIVAIDLPGHGHSSAIGDTAFYHLLDAGLLLPRIVDALGWQHCHLIGHSLGGNLSTIAAVASAEHFLSLVLLESLGPLTEPAEKLPERLMKALQHRTNPERFDSRTFDDPQQAVESRLAAAKMTQRAAELIIERQVKAVPGGWQWCFDPKQRMASSVYLSEEQALVLLASLSLRTLVVLAEDGYLVNRDETEQRLAHIPKLEKVSVPGNHHMHMDDPQPTAQVLCNFLRNM